MKKALEALDKKVLPHWKSLIKNPRGGSPSADNCAFCQMYDGCEGCPISIYMDNDPDYFGSGCCGTPWEDFYDLWSTEGPEESLREAAEKEYEFLNVTIRKFIEENL